MLAVGGAAAGGLVMGWLAGLIPGRIAARAAGPTSFATLAWWLAGGDAPLAAAGAGAAAFAVRARGVPLVLQAVRRRIR
jgi:hypothetical protein